jgi:thiamine thiazole synthase
MARFDDTEISRAIVNAYHQALADRLVNDVIIVGAGPAGLVAGHHLARQGFKVTLLEKRLAPGGGIWGGGMGMNYAVVQDDAVPLLQEAGVRCVEAGGGLHTVDTIELAAALSLKAVQAGVSLLNLATVEDVYVLQNRVVGVVINRTMISGALHVDPITMSARAVIDGTGHEAIVVEALRKRPQFAQAEIAQPRCEGPMDATGGEAFVVENTRQVFPGLWVTGMSVCAVLRGPRMGPIFGGMLLSGQRVAALVAQELKTSR